MQPSSATLLTPTHRHVLISIIHRFNNSSRNIPARHSTTYVYCSSLTAPLAMSALFSIFPSSPFLPFHPSFSFSVSLSSLNSSFLFLSFPTSPSLPLSLSLSHLYLFSLSFSLSLSPFLPPPSLPSSRSPVSRPSFLSPAAGRARCPDRSPSARFISVCSGRNHRPIVAARRGGSPFYRRRRPRCRDASDDAPLPR